MRLALQTNQKIKHHWPRDEEASVSKPVPQTLALLKGGRGLQAVDEKFSPGSAVQTSLFSIPDFAPVERVLPHRGLNDICVVIFNSDNQSDDRISSQFICAQGFFLGGTFNNGYRLTKRIRAIQPHIVLLDIKLPDMCSLEAVKLIRSTFPKVKILMLATFEEDDTIVDAICAGAAGVILKNQSTENILESILKLQQGETLISSFILHKVIELLHHLNVPSRINQYNLTTRETEVVKHMLEGASYKIISARLGISYDTVHNHIRNIYSKLHVNSMSEAISKVLKTQMNWLSSVT